MTDCYDHAAGSGAYALNALSPAEAAEFEGALAQSDELRAELAGLVDTAALLGLAVPPSRPSDALTRSIFAAIDSTPQQSAPTVPAPAPAPAAPQAHVAPRRARRVRPLVALAAAAAAVVLFFSGTVLGGLVNAVSGERVADRFAALNAAPDVARSVVTLPDGGTAALVASAQLGMSAVVLNGAHELPTGKTFQVWYAEGGGMVSAGLVQPAKQGSEYRMLDRPYKGEQVAMTLEPAGGSPQPTTSPIFLTGA